MVKFLFCLLVACVGYGDTLFLLNERFQGVLDQVPEIRGRLVSVEPLPDQGGSFINSVYLVRTTEGEEFVLKIENELWENKKNCE